MQRLLIFLGFMGFGTLMIYLFAVSGGEPPPAEVELFQGRPNLLFLSGVDHREQTEGQLTTEMTAEKTQWDENSLDARMEGVNFRMLDPTPEGNPILKLTGKAPLALMNKKKNTIEMSGGVLLADQDGRQLTSETFFYNGKSQRLHAPGNVKITSEEGVQEGSSMVYLLKEGKMTLRKPLFYQ